jgi:hypothetical protein
MLYDRLILKEDRIENYVTQVDHLKDEARRLEKERVRFLTSKKTFELINIRKEFLIFFLFFFVFCLGTIKS